MNYKSNRQARSEFLENEMRNRERNRRAYAKRKAGARFDKIGIVAFLFFLIALYLVSHHRH